VARSSAGEPVTRIVRRGKATAHGCLLWGGGIANGCHSRRSVHPARGSLPDSVIAALRRPAAGPAPGSVARETYQHPDEKAHCQRSRNEQKPSQVKRVRHRHSRSAHQTCCRPESGLLMGPGAILDLQQRPACVNMEHGGSKGFINYAAKEEPGGQPGGVAEVRLLLQSSSLPHLWGSAGGFEGYSAP